VRTVLAVILMVTMAGCSTRTLPKASVPRTSVSVSSWADSVRAAESDSVRAFAAEMNESVQSIGRSVKSLIRQRDYWRSVALLSTRTARRDTIFTVIYRHIQANGMMPPVVVDDSFHIYDPGVRPK